MYALSEKSFVRLTRLVRRELYITKSVDKIVYDYICEKGRKLLLRREKRDLLRNYHNSLYQANV